jgi:hypothetical protein
MEAPANHGINLPEKPRIKQHAPPPDARKFAVIPFKACADPRLRNAALRVLAVLCSYANRAGLTYVGQHRIASDLGMHQSAVAREITVLKRCGYIERIKKGWKGTKGDTIRVIYGAGISADDALGIAGSSEEVRLPDMIEHENRELQKVWTEAEIRDNKARLAGMLAQAFKRPAEAKLDVYKPVKGDTVMVSKIKQGLVKPKVKPIVKPVDNPVDNSVVEKSECYINTKNLSLSIVIDILSNSIDKVNYPKVNKPKVNYLRLTIGESDIKTLELLCEVGVTESELVQAMADMPDARTASDIALAVLASKGIR